MFHDGLVVLFVEGSERDVLFDLRAAPFALSFVGGRTMLVPESPDRFDRVVGAIAINVANRTTSRDVFCPTE